MKKAIMLALALAVLCTGAAWAQVGSVIGVVVDRAGVPVEGARVSLHQDGACAGYVLTDAVGAFTLADVEPGIYTLQASKPRIGTVTVVIEVMDGELVDVGTLQLVGKNICVPAPPCVPGPHYDR
jgi:hypothetical protein